MGDRDGAAANKRARGGRETISGGPQECCVEMREETERLYLKMMAFDACLVCPFVCLVT